MDLLNENYEGLKKLLRDGGWILECISPLQLRSNNNLVVTGDSAMQVITNLRKDSVADAARKGFNDTGYKGSFEVTKDGFDQL